ncbi:hypothetical protein QT969_20190 [Rhodococcus sp. CSLK01-03]|uniref:Uncharacterized protein n=1 Tax=Rhodococcus indonesiensis TaxID=3055869 RepID=A0ABT7RSJ1_9NOCA|nr:hypothetical protein [Rhodococcus indonesiensis]MDM7490609.1 hypothetical protein [Rhodococcus indonesiensis]
MPDRVVVDFAVPVRAVADFAVVDFAVSVRRGAVVLDRAVLDFAVVDFAVVDFAVVDLAVVDFAVAGAAVVDFVAAVRLRGGRSLLPVVRPASLRVVRPSAVPRAPMHTATPGTAGETRREGSSRLEQNAHNGAIARNGDHS